MRLLKRAKSHVQPSVRQTREPRRTCMRNIYIYIYFPYRHVANDEAHYYTHLRLYCKLYVYKYVYPIQIYQIYCTMLDVSAENVTGQRARSRDLRHEASTVGATATMASAVGHWVLNLTPVTLGEWAYWQPMAVFIFHPSVPGECYASQQRALWSHLVLKSLDGCHRE